LHMPNAGFSCRSERSEPRVAETGSSTPSSHASSTSTRGVQNANYCVEDLLARPVVQKCKLPNV
jgi:hypothetical protein